MTLEEYPHTYQYCLYFKLQMYKKLKETHKCVFCDIDDPYFSYLQRGRKDVLDL